MAWIRTCQACGHVQPAIKPMHSKLTDSYAFSKCRKCKSEALDYGRDDSANDDYTSEDE